MWLTLVMAWEIGISFCTTSWGPGSISRDGNRGVAGGVFNLFFHKMQHAVTKLFSIFHRSNNHAQWYVCIFSHSKLTNHSHFCLFPETLNHILSSLMEFCTVKNYLKWYVIFFLSKITVWLMMSTYQECHY